MVSSLAVPCSLRLEVVALESGAQEGQGKSRSPLVVSARSQTDSSRPEGSFRYQPWSDLSASNQSFRAGSNAAVVRDLSRERRGRPRGVPRILRGLVVRFVVGDHDSRRDCQPGGRHVVSRERSLCASCRDCRAPLGSGCWRRLSSVETRRVHSRRRDRPVKVSWACTFSKTSSRCRLTLGPARRLCLADANLLAIRRLLSRSLSVAHSTTTPGPPLPPSHPSPSLLSKLHLQVYAHYDEARSLLKSTSASSPSPATSSGVLPRRQC